MRLANHATNTKNFYHFEDSDDCCEPDVVTAAAERLRQSKDLNTADAAQLETIVLLELLRYEYAAGEMPVDDLKSQIQKLRNTLIDVHGREPFDNGNIDKDFYRFLNEEYGLVTK